VHSPKVQVQTQRVRERPYLHLDLQREEELLARVDAQRQGVVASADEVVQRAHLRLFYTCFICARTIFIFESMVSFRYVFYTCAQPLERMVQTARCRELHCFPATDWRDGSVGGRFAPSTHIVNDRLPLSSKKYIYFRNMSRRRVSVDQCSGGEHAPVNERAWTTAGAKHLDTKHAQISNAKRGAASTRGGSGVAENSRQKVCDGGGTAIS
jgi:hypothetical protein